MAEDVKTMLEEFLKNLETISDEELMNELDQAAEDSKDSWMLDSDFDLM